MRTILIIEDNDEIRDNTAELLSINHYNVLTAENGRAGFDVAESKNPDLILCDMVMPETDGQGFLELLKKNESIQKIPIIFFSAGTSLPSIQKKLIKAADGFLKKPFQEEDLITSIESVLAK
jgi:CheY-like chemotaxis protein